MKKYFFPIIKFSSILLLLSYFVISEQGSTVHIGMELFLLSCLLSVSVIYELTDKYRFLFLLAETGLLLVLLFLYGQYCFLLIPLVSLDLITFLGAPIFFYFIPLSGAFYYQEQAFIYIAFCFFAIILYIQNHIILKEYRTHLENFEKQEDTLKRSLSRKDVLRQKELEQNSLYFENKILEEKSRLSQSLHDKLGHSVNGSIYQLEACKVLLSKEPEESRHIIERVIHTLRESMDEIRTILREEKPDKKRMALLQLNRLCENCREKYDIHAEVILEDTLSTGPALISEQIWEVILDNTFEAVSNALKYANCQNIRIHIIIWNKFVRCHITDDGVGCEQIVEGMGLQGMKQRTREIGGTLSVESEKGFAINMILPFE